jgi:DNA gyrase subunit B
VHQPLTEDADLSTIAVWTEALSAKLNRNIQNQASYKLQVQPDDSDAWSIQVLVMTHGVEKRLVIPASLFKSSEYQRFVGFGQKLDGLFQESTRAIIGDRETPVANFSELFQLLMIEARKGQQIQRYKGLGEMNPDQLWETTLNAESRRVLQVRIEDAIAADEVFTTLMGDQVEPRRKFIERNALDVSNLDV